MEFNEYAFCLYNIIFFIIHFLMHVVIHFSYFSGDKEILAGKKAPTKAYVGGVFVIRQALALWEYIFCAVISLEILGNLC